MKTENHIQEELNTLSPTLAQLLPGHPFSVPNGYFEQNITDLQSIIFLEKLGRPHVGTVPALYFETFPEKMLAIAKAESAEVLPMATNVFSVPQGYFDAMPAKMLELAKQQGAQKTEVQLELEQLSPLLAGIGSENVYKVPVDYFKNISVPAPEKQEAKVVRMSPLRSLKYAAAAVITGILAITIYFAAFNNDGVKGANYSATVIDKAGQIVQTNSFDEEFNKLSDEQIENYLLAKGTNIEAALVASSTANSDSLPDPVDYLIDENTLNNYLNELNITN